MSVFLMSSIAALAYIGVFDFKNFPDMPNFVKIIACIAVFLTFFLLFFFLLNLRLSSKKKKAAAIADAAAVAVTEQEGNLNGAHAPMAAGSVEVPAGVTRHQGGLLATGLLAAVSARQRNDSPPPARIDETARQDVIYEENGVPYINSDLARRNNQEPLNSKFAKLVESVTGGLTPPAPRQQDKP